MRPSYFIQLRLSVMMTALLLVGCEVPGMGPDPKIALRQADGKAIGAACRHALRGIEDCYGLNEKALKTSVFEGWKEMDQYMRDNKIEGVAPKAAKTEAAEDMALVVEKNPKHDAKEKVAGDTHSKADTGKSKTSVKLAQTSEGH